MYSGIEPAADWSGLGQCFCVPLCLLCLGDTFMAELYRWLLVHWSGLSQAEDPRFTAAEVGFFLMVHDVLST